MLRLDLDKLGQLHMVLSTIVATATLGIAPARCDVIPVGSEFQVNQWTDGGQEQAAVAHQSDGSFLAVWGDFSGTPDGSDRAVIGRLFDASATPLTGDFVINSDTVGAQHLPSVAAIPGGGFAVAWRTFESGAEGIRAQLLDAAGAKVGSEVVVASDTSSSTLTTVRPRIAAGTLGGFLVVWEEDSTAFGGPGFGQLLDSSLALSGSKFALSPYTAKAPTPAVAALTGGRYLVGWEGNVPGLAGAALRVFDSAGVPLGAQLGTSDSSEDWDGGALVSVAGGLDGGFAAVAYIPGNSVIGTSLFDPAASRKGGVATVDGTATSIGLEISISAGPGGTYLAAWSHDQAGTDGPDVFAQLIDGEGNPVGSSLPVNTFTQDPQVRPAVSWDGADSFVIVWESWLGIGPGQDGSFSGVFGQRYCFDNNANGVCDSVDLCGNDVIDAGESCDGTSDAACPGSCLADCVCDPCGNGILDAGESCDGAADAACPGLCTSTCECPTCGNDVAEPGEQCDGLDSPACPGACLSSCVCAVCGDGTQQTGEECDTFDDAACDSVCRTDCVCADRDFVSDGGEVLVNTTTGGNQSHPRVACHVDGSFVVVWESAGQDSDFSSAILIQRFDTLGNPVAGEVQVNTVTALEQRRPDVDALGAGAFAVAWDSERDLSALTDVFARRFDSSGSPVSGEFQVSTSTTVGASPATDTDQTAAAILGKPDGSFVVAWERALHYPDGQGLVSSAQRIDASGLFVGGEFDIVASASNEKPSVSDLGGDNLIFTAHEHTNSSPQGVGFRRHDASGPVGSSTFINDLSQATVAAQADSSFVVAAASTDTTDGEITTELVLPNGVRSFNPQIVNTYTTGDQRWPRIASHPDGGYVLVWESEGQDGDGLGVFGRRLDDQGLPVGPEFRVNETRLGEQSSPDVCVGASGDIVAVWESGNPPGPSQDGSGTGIYMRRFCVDANGTGVCDEVDLCGDNILGAGEECDGSDDAACPGGCLANCTCSTCGDNTRDVGEQCDGSDDSVCPGLCGADCFCDPCGNNIVDAPGEECDGTDDSACPGACSALCECDLCGNGALDAGEECDDGNEVGGDCCSATCTNEPDGQACADDGDVCTVDQCDGFGNCTHANTCINDDCAVPTVIGSTPFSDTVSTIGATGDASDPVQSCTGSQNTNSVWYEFVAPGAGTVTANTTGSSYDTVLSAYSGTCGSLVEVACDDDTGGVQSEISFSTSSGVTYLIEVTDFGATAGGGSLQFALDFSVPGTPTSTPTPTAVPTSTGTPTPACDPTPLSGCRAAGKSIVLFKQKQGGIKDKLIWKWLKGAASVQSDFGDPLGGAQHSMCVYDSSGFVLETTVPPGGFCAGKPCWKTLSHKGYKYKDRDAQTDGVQKMLFKGGDAGRAKVLVKGKGFYLPDPDLSALTLPLTVQMVNSNNANCFASTFDSEDVIKSESDFFKAKN